MRARGCGHFLSPFDDPDVIEGQASVAVEMLEAQMPAPDVVILPVGGGGLSAGIDPLFPGRAPPSAYVEPAGGACLHGGAGRGEPVT